MKALTELIRDWWKAREEEKILNTVAEVTPHQAYRLIKVGVGLVMVCVVIVTGLSIQVQRRNSVIDRMDAATTRLEANVEEVETQAAAGRRASEEARDAVAEARAALEASRDEGSNGEAVAEGLRAIARIEQRLNELFPKE